MEQEKEVVLMVAELWRRRLEFLWSVTELSGPLDIEWIDNEIIRQEASK